MQLLILLIASFWITLPSFGNVEFIESDVYVLGPGGNVKLEKTLGKNSEKELFNIEA